MKERWQKQWEEDRKGQWLYNIQWTVGEMRSTGRNGRRLYLDTLAAHITHISDCSREQETICLLHCQKYVMERRQLIKKLDDMKVKLDLFDLFCVSSISESYQAVFWFLRQTHLFGRM